MNFDNSLRHIYRDPRRPREVRRDPDGTEWIKLDEIDLTTGHVTHHDDYQPFAQTQFDQWKPRHW